MTYSTETIWGIIIALGIGTYLLRLSFLGLIGDRPLPEWILRHLRYTAVAVIPALVAPLVIWPDATDGQTDPARLAAGIVTLSVGMLTKSVIGAILSGALTLIVLTQILG